jgi:hypothetical protein
VTTSLYNKAARRRQHNLQNQFDQILLPFQEFGSGICCPVSVGRPLWREAGSVLCKSQSSHLSVSSFIINIFIFHTFTIYILYLYFIYLYTLFMFGPSPLFQFPNPVHSRRNSLDGGSAHLKSCTYTKHNTDIINEHKHPYLEWYSNPATPAFERSEDSSYNCDRHQNK